MTKEPLTITKDEQDRLYARIPQVFSPGTPITRRQLFAGRTDQRTQVLGAIYHPGQHVIIFGDRGIGKTSLASVLNDYAGSTDSFLLFRINCGSDDTFDSAWRKMFTQITVGIAGSPEEERKTISENIGSVTITPFIVQQQLTPISHDLNRHIIMIFDEFDTILDSIAKRLFAETIKALSDFAVPVTIVLVGIADSVNRLIAEHQSIERNLIQVRMPRMTPLELEEILITNALEPLGIGIHNFAKNWIVRLSQGLPYYAHLIGLNSALIATSQLKRNIDEHHVALAISKAVEQTNHSIKNLYAMAISCTRRNIFKQVLLACALAPANSLGDFAAVDVRLPLRKIMKDNSYDIDSFAPHLNAFSTKRGPILIKSGTKKNFRYRFKEPVLQPYIIMDAVSTGLLPADYFSN